MLGVPVEERLHITLPPWTDCSRVAVRMDVDADFRRASQAIWIWSDGSAEDGVTAGGGGALITLPSGEESEIRTPAGAVGSSTRAELVAMRQRWRRCGTWEQPTWRTLR